MSRLTEAKRSRHEEEEKDFDEAGCKLALVLATIHQFHSINRSQMMKVIAKKQPEKFHNTIHDHRHNA